MALNWIVIDCFFVKVLTVCVSLLANVDKYGITINQWASSNVIGVNEINVNSVCADDWTVERVIIAGIVNSDHVDDWTVERVIITSNVNSVHVDDWTIEWEIIASNVNSLYR